jgi:hypothetical protein
MLAPFPWELVACSARGIEQTIADAVLGSGGGVDGTCFFLIAFVPDVSWTGETGETVG